MNLKRPPKKIHARKRPKSRRIDLDERAFFHAIVRPVILLCNRPLNFANQLQATGAIRHDRQALAGLRERFEEALLYPQFEPA